MAKIATPRLIDVAPTPTGLRSVPDRLIEVGVKAEGVRVTVRSESGAISAAITLTVSNGLWADCTVAATKDADPSTFSRVNRLLKGYQPQHPTLTGFAQKMPKLGNYWRTKEHSMFLGGQVVSLPAVAEGNVRESSSAVWLRWSVRNVPLMLDSNAALGYTPIAAQSTSSKRRSKSSAVKMGAVSVNQPTTQQTIRQKVSADPVTPKGATAGTTVTPTAKTSPVTLQVTALPQDHPGIFREMRLTKSVHVTPETDQVLTKAYEGFTLGDRTVIILRGPSGAGKTITAMALAAKYHLPFWKVDVAALRDFSDWAGSMTLTADSEGEVVTAYQPSQLMEAIRADGPYAGIPRMVLLDEINRCETPGALNAAGPILDGTGTLYIPDARQSIAIDPAVLFVGTANIGAEFTGTSVLDHMIVTRGTCWWDVDYPSQPTEATILVEQGGVDQTTAERLVSVAVQVRAIAARMEITVGVSTRQLVSAALLVSRGLKPSLACKAAFGNTYSPEGGASSDRFKVEQAIQTILGN